MIKNDWRLQGQEKYLLEASLVFRKYNQPAEKWDHDHCDFCWAKFSEKEEDALNEGYTTSDSYTWICKKCFEDFKDQFKWKVQFIDET